jgi:hypothetical protein
MKKFSFEYSNFLYESLKDELKDKLSNDYSSLKEGILDLIENSINNYDELVNVQNFIGDYIKNPNEKNLNNFIEENDIFDFYLKYQIDIDQICTDKNYFNEKPSTNNIFSLYSFVIEGSKFAVLEGMKIIQKEVFSIK